MKAPVAAALAKLLKVNKEDVVVEATVSATRRMLGSSVTFNGNVPYSSDADAASAAENLDSQAIAAEVTDSIKANPELASLGVTASVTGSPEAAHATTESPVNNSVAEPASAASSAAMPSQTVIIIAAGAGGAVLLAVVAWSIGRFCCRGTKRTEHRAKVVPERGHDCV